MSLPTSTYRIQLHKFFSFKDLDQQVDYLARLGVDTFYCSPIFMAVPGSRHGYDVTDPNTLNPEIGTQRQLFALRKKLRLKGLKWLQDIVPNHMAFHPANSRLMDVLEHGPLSPFHRHFDTSIGSSFFQGKLMVPVLENDFNTSISRQEIKIIREGAKLYLAHQGQNFPLNPKSYLPPLKNLNDRLDSKNEILTTLIGELKRLTSKKYTLQQWEKWLQQFTKLLEEAPLKLEFDGTLDTFNSNSSLIKDLGSVQYYELCRWTETQQRINYRRFFIINGLICINVHENPVLDDTHKLILSLVKKSIFDGLRVDHIDGLYKPSTYLTQLRKRCGNDTSLFVEKILENNEELPSEWEIEGSTGYDFLSFCNNVLTDPKGKSILTTFYDEKISPGPSLKQQYLQKKALILNRYMQGEINNLTRLCIDLNLAPNDKYYPDDDLKNAIAAFLVYFPVYRLYGESFPLRSSDYKMVTRVWRNILSDGYEDFKTIRHFRSIFRRAQFGNDVNLKKNLTLFFLRCMQLTGPLMAKGVEDTLMYTYHRFIAHNEVGDNPGNFGIKPKDFHRAMKNRQHQWPLAMNATSTHDTKRGEDARARLLVLSAAPKTWVKQVESWMLCLKTYPGNLPDTNDIYFIFQTLVSSHPFPGKSLGDYTKRLLAYLEKYVREAKIHSHWEEVNDEYENTIKSFTKWLLNRKSPFYVGFVNYLKTIVDFGLVNSLSQVMLKFTAPGIPDVYQGTELWDFSFVDPDNRRLVDYKLRQKFLNELDTTSPDLITSLWDQRADGKIKLALVHTLFQLRKSKEALFASGNYRPVRIRGKYRRHFLGFSRNYEGDQVVVLIPLHLAALPSLKAPNFPSFDWNNTRIDLDSPIRWRNMLNSKEGFGPELLLNDLFSTLPLAILTVDNTEPKE